MWDWKCLFDKRCDIDCCFTSWIILLYFYFFKVLYACIFINTLSTVFRVWRPLGRVKYIFYMRHFLLCWLNFSTNNIYVKFKKKNQNVPRSPVCTWPNSHFFLSGGTDQNCNIKHKTEHTRELGCCMIGIGLSSCVEISTYDSGICQCVSSVTRQVGHSMALAVVRHWKCRSLLYTPRL